MKKTVLWIIALCTCAFSFANPAFAGHMVNERRQGHILYRFSDNAPDYKKARAQLILSAYGARQERLVGPQSNRLDRVNNMRNKPEEQICRELKASGGVDFAEPDYLVPPELVPNDPRYSSQWHHAVMNSPAAWDKTTGVPSVIVAVCDTGVESNHPDLAANLILPGTNTVDGTTNTTPVMFHGTAVAGCIGAIGNNAAGVAGMAWGIKILPIRVSNTSDGYAYFSDIAEAVYYAVDHGAKVINISYGVGNSATIDSAAQYARSKGSLVFASAGNNGVEVVYPDYASFVLVGATTSSDARASWSNFGTAVDVVAPGESIMTTTTGSAYGSASGTSFSSPIAAGLAALVYSINPNFTPAQVESFIFSTCKDLGDPGEDITFGRGRIDAAAAVNAAMVFQGNTPPVALMQFTPETANAPALITFNAGLSYDSDGSVASYAWNFGDGATGSGMNVSHTYTKAGTYTITLTVKDNLGDAASTQKSIVINPNPNDIAAPSGLAAAVSGRAVTLTWKDNSSNEEGFFIERKAKTRTGAYARIAEVKTGITTYIDSFAGPGAYYYRVQGFNRTTGKLSPYSNEASARIVK